MVYTVKVELDGRIILPEELTRELGVSPGTELILEIENGCVMLKVKSSHPEAHPVFIRDISPNKSVQDFLDEYERKYHLTSEEFYRKYHAGELEENLDFIDWIGHYETKLAAEKQGLDASQIYYERVVPEEHK